jgi:cytochrome P450
MTALEDVSSDIVLPYDHIYGPEVSAFPPSAVDRYRERLPIFYSSEYGGFWVLTRYADIRAVFQDTETFIQHSGGLPYNPYSKIHIPLMLNPPEHTKYRKLMTPIFAPRMVAKLEPIVRDIARKQIALIAPHGRCEFVDDFAMVLPAAMFCGMLGIDPANFPQFNRLSLDLIFGAADVMAREGEEAARQFRAKTSAEIDALMADILVKRKAVRGEDVLSILLDAQIDERQLTDDEMLNIASLLFFAGTDSTASMISYSFMHLAETPENRRRIATDAAIIPNAVAELIRFHGFHHIRREASRDVEIEGVLIRRGDIVLLPTGGANHDPRKFPEPLTIDLDRGNAGGNMSFGAGPHRCIGQHLAMLQLRIALEEFHQAIPEYRLDPDQSPQYMSSQAKTVLRRLPMLFTPVSA